MTVTTPSRGRGRPKDPKREMQVREALMQSAYALLRDKSVRDISIREIALGAGVNSAMISYHFGGKEALIIEVMHSQFMLYGPEFLNTGLGGKEPSVEMLKEAMARIIRLYIREPWIPRLIVSEVAAKPGQMRDLFTRRLASELGPKLRELLDVLQSSGHLRQDLDTNLMPISFISLIAFPFVTGDPLKKVFAFMPDESNGEKWIEHSVQFLLHGVANTPIAVDQKNKGSN
ncbi:TetR/AcrR family transcriptional regulator [uncultured Microbulbifer sp.]|uniref:TetR/AcrR family transcriptional regulator n=1 Tax=uncultured Microbulbifer sp. TaxID=348147 RepID=UPI00262A546E|nr:TetR/AcrR family transcriptional regulator [uncultured Microbulbifer sp.]